MVPKLIFMVSAAGVAVAALALMVAATVGFLVWLGGSNWARRP